MMKKSRVLMLVENLTVPGDPRVWAEATTLRDAGVQVSIICPKGKSQQEAYVCIEGVHIYRYGLPVQGTGLKGYCVEYGIAFLMTLWLSFIVFLRRGFDVIHAANPPDFFFVIGLVYRIVGKKFVFDQHDPAPEMCLAKFTGQGGETFAKAPAALGILELPDVACGDYIERVAKGFCAGAWACFC